MVYIHEAGQTPFHDIFGATFARRLFPIAEIPEAVIRCGCCCEGHGIAVKMHHLSMTKRTFDLRFMANQQFINVKVKNDCIFTKSMLEMVECANLAEFIAGAVL